MGISRRKKSKPLDKADHSGDDEQGDG